MTKHNQYRVVFIYKNLFGFTYLALAAYCDHSGHFLVTNGQKYQFFLFYGTYSEARERKNYCMDCYG